MIRLLENGEHRLLRAVESGQIPVSVAVEIADSGRRGVQQALQQAYEKNLLRGRKLLAAKRLIEQRRRRGKGSRNGPTARTRSLSSGTRLIRAYREDVDKKRLLIRKAEATRDRLVFVARSIAERSSRTSTSSRCCGPKGWTPFRAIWRTASRRRR